eukprot:6428027-Amphidinium_carterae.1
MSLSLQNHGELAGQVGKKLASCFSAIFEGKLRQLPPRQAFSISSFAERAPAYNAKGAEHAFCSIPCRFALRVIYSTLTAILSQMLMLPSFIGRCCSKWGCSQVRSSAFIEPEVQDQLHQTAC